MRPKMNTSIKKILTTALAVTAFSSYAIPAASAEAEKAPSTAWQEYKIVTDTSPIEDQFLRYDTNQDYHDAVENLISKEAGMNVTNGLSFGEFSKRYIVFWNAHINSDLTMDIIEGFDGNGDKNGFSFQTLQSSNLNYNMKYVLDCRTEILSASDKPKSDYLTYKKVRGCALDKIEQAKADFTQLIKYVQVDPASLKDKQTRYKNSESYKSAFQAHAQKLVKQDIIANMTFDAALILSHAILDKNVTWNDLKDVADEDDADNSEFVWDTPSANVIDNNIKLIFEARNEILPDVMPTDLKQRIDLYNNIVQSAFQKTLDQHQALKDTIIERAKNVHVDIGVSVEDKISQFKKGDKDKNSIYAVYTEAVKKQANAEFKAQQLAKDYYINYIKIWHSVLDNDIGNVKQLSNNLTTDFTYLGDKFWSPYLQENIDTLFTCREETIGDTKLTDLKNPEIAFTTIYQCAREKIDVAYKKYTDALEQKNSDPAYGEEATYNHWFYAEKAHTDENYTAVELSQKGLTGLDASSSSLTRNFNIILQCRDKIKSTGTITYDAVHDCASKIVLKQSTDEKHRISQIWTIVAGGSTGALILGGVGFGIHRRRKKQPQLKAN